MQELEGKLERDYTTDLAGTTLYVYNWGDYIDPDVIKEFEKETGIELKGEVPSDRSHPHFEDYRQYYRELYRRYVRRYVDAVHEQYPDFE